LRNLPEKCNDEVHYSTSWGEVVEGYQRVHFEFSPVQKSLNQDNPDRFECDSAHLEQETGEDEINLAERGNDDTDDYERDVEEGFEVGFFKTQDPSG
jgi:hypothetical protein